jgi:hypothetical protein
MEPLVIMLVVAAVSVVAGVVLRQRWTVLSILPAMLVATLVIAGVGMAMSFGFWSIALAVVASAVCLQVGYLAGGAVDLAALAARKKRAPKDGC